MHKPNERSLWFRSVITAFIEERRTTKLKGGDAEVAKNSAAKYDYYTWLGDAASRVREIQAVTHVLKATHPDARGSSLYAAPSSLPQHAEIGTHALGQTHADDVVGNAAALDVYKFLDKVEVEGQRLLHWMQADDQDLLSALHDDPTIAGEWIKAFKGLVRTGETPVSHQNAKQLYWNFSGEPTDDSGYHLLQPLFSSSLAHAVHADICDARFGEDNKAARQARKEQKSHAGTYRDYRNLVVRKLGGTNPQNISQLNSKRGGENYLLASLPPIWNHDQPRHFRHIDSALPRFWYYEGVQSRIRALIELLQSNPKPTMETRVTRERIERALGESLAAFGLATQQLFTPGWTRDDDCQLPLCEQVWLDPERAELSIRPDHAEEDRAFIAALQRQDWSDQVAHRFGNWLNDILHKQGLPVGEVEHARWARQAIIDVAWPASMQRRANGGQA